MSYYPATRHPDHKNCEVYVTLKRWKHMPENWKICRIRRLMWKAQHFKKENCSKYKCGI